MSGRTVVAAVLGVCIASVLSGVPGGSSASPARPERGGQLFFESGCYGCHTVGAMGTPIGPDLRRVGSRMTVAELEQWLREPSAVRPRAHMPRLELAEDEIRALCAYLASLR